MKTSAIASFCCPKCRATELELKEGQPQPDSDEIDEGLLACGRCSATYRIRRGIPRFVASEEYTDNFGFQWNRFRKTQLDSHTGLPISSDRLFKVTRWMRNMTGQAILEAGSGAGRFTQVLLATGALVFSFDLSNAVEANAENNRERRNLRLFQASITEIPLPEASFDKVLCLGVLQHTPDPERSFHYLAKFVKPGGEIAVDVYARRPSHLASWKYVLRPITTRMPKDRLFRWVEKTVNALLPSAIILRKIGGRYAAKLLPIVQYSHLGLPPDLNREWATLDTFDMYSPVHDHPRSRAEVARWFAADGFENVVVEYGPNGVVARGRRPERAPSMHASPALHDGTGAAATPA